MGILRFFFKILGLCALVVVPGAAQNITTIAGGGPHNLNSLQVGLAQAAGIALDGAGNVYVSLAQVNQIWRIDPSGQVNLWAGNGSFPFDADGVPAVTATLYQPQGLAFDAAGNLYVADSGHNRVRRIAANGIITTVAGTGTASFSGDGGLAVNAALNNPVAVAVDSANNLYIADKNNQRVRVVSAGGTINTFAGSTLVGGFSGDGAAANLAALNAPDGVAVDSAGVIYIADAGNFRVRKVAAGIITTFAGNGVFGAAGIPGPATSAQLNTISGVAVDVFNNVYIAEAYDVRVVVAGSATIQTAAGTANPGYSGDGGAPMTATFRNIAGVTLDGAGAYVYILDTGNYRIRRANRTSVSTYTGNGTLDYDGDGQNPLNANFLTPNTVAANGSGSLIFADVGSSSVRRMASVGGGTLSTVLGTGVTSYSPDNTVGPVNSPFALTYALDRTSFYFTEGNRVRRSAGGSSVTVANSAGTGNFSGDGGAATAAQFNIPSGLALAANGDLYVADTANYRVRAINGVTGVVTTVAGNGTQGASTGDGGAAVNAALNYPSPLALDGNGNLYIGEILGNRIRKVNLATNTITTVAGDGTTNFADGVAAVATGLSGPLSIAVDQSGDVFIADQGHSRVRKVTAATGLISTVAGNGVYDFAGDGGLATAAAVNPLGIALDAGQNLYIADSSGRIRTTQVQACFFTLSTPTVYRNSAGGTGSVTITATNSSCPYTVSGGSPFVTITSGASGTGSGTITFSVAADPGQNRTATVGVAGQSFTVAQAGAVGQYNVGYFQPTNGPVWALDANGSGQYDAGDRSFTFAGPPGAIAVTGDWNGDGRTKVGYFLNGYWVLDYNGNGIYDPGGPNGDRYLGYGDSSYTPVVGDWNGDGKTKIGLYKAGFWILDMNGNGVYDAGDAFYGFGGATGELPFVGDWNGDGRTKIGVFQNGTWLLDYDGNGSFTAADKYYVFPFQTGDLPVIGDWSGDKKTKIGIYRNGFWVLDYNGNGSYDGIGPGQDKFYGFGGHPGDIPIVADWSGDGKSKIGTYNGGFWTLDFNGNGGFDGLGPGQDRFVPFGGTPGNQPIVGRW